MSVRLHPRPELRHRQRPQRADLRLFPLAPRRREEALRPLVAQPRRVADLVLRLRLLLLHLRQPRDPPRRLLQPARRLRDPLVTVLVRSDPVSGAPRLRVAFGDPSFRLLPLPLHLDQAARRVRRHAVEGRLVADSLAQRRDPGPRPRHGPQPVQPALQNPSSLLQARLIRQNGGKLRLRLGLPPHQPTKLAIRLQGLPALVLERQPLFRQRPRQGLAPLVGTPERACLGKELGGDRPGRSQVGGAHRARQPVLHALPALALQRRQLGKRYGVHLPKDLPRHVLRKGQGPVAQVVGAPVRRRPPPARRGQEPSVNLQLAAVVQADAGLRLGRPAVPGRVGVLRGDGRSEAVEEGGQQGKEGGLAALVGSQHHDDGGQRRVARAHAFEPTVARDLHGVEPHVPPCSASSIREAASSGAPFISSRK